MPCQNAVSPHQTLWKERHPVEARHASFKRLTRPCIAESMAAMPDEAPF
jgi:hypothetical protein